MPSFEIAVCDFQRYEAPGRRLRAWRESPTGRRRTTEEPQARDRPRCTSRLIGSETVLHLTKQEKLNIPSPSWHVHLTDDSKVIASLKQQCKKPNKCDTLEVHLAGKCELKALLVCAAGSPVSAGMQRAKNSQSTSPSIFKCRIPGQGSVGRSIRRCAGHGGTVCDVGWVRTQTKVPRPAPTGTALLLFALSLAGQQRDFHER